ncbi:hypothetical protein ACFQI7_10905 [Paenibacillus allorhizosphaerae]|uniref:Uncharacterized protein n=1 Tax=Paenibacillus allorhizosphaerae TaxID=2849866 RepID=A0ABN7TN33_9BACL|nr:hypothetical protein [Paenibacillus allorhizosphaerae]CAG7642809.1 hypothetical protein PAECIP111802_02906 [Paenibacillus allorhizosphaerae]
MKHRKWNKRSRDAGKQVMEESGDTEGAASLRRSADHGAKLRRSGEVVAALLSLVFAMAALTGAHWWSAADPGRANMTLLRYSSWLPNGWRIGPYGGKELVALAVWLGSWSLLLLLFGRHRFSLKPWMYVFLAGVFVLLLLLWPPVYHRIYGWPV